jgi:hypothetical protein
MKTVLMLGRGLTAFAWLAISADVLSSARIADRLVCVARWRSVAGRLGVLVALLWSTVCSATATATVIPGDPLQIFMDGSGRLQARFQGSSVGELRPGSLDLADPRSGMVFTISSSPTSVWWCGSGRGTSTSLSAPVVTGSGTLADPYRMSTSYACDTYAPRLDVTQTFVYVNGQDEFLARYSVSNPTDQPARFSAISRGVFTLAGSGQGQGFLDATPPRTIGVFSDEQGSEGGLVEATSTPWARYTEGALPTGSAYEPGESSFFGALDDMVDPQPVADPRIAVYFDRYATSGLAPGATDAFDVVWFFAGYDGLSLSPLGDSHNVGQTQSVSARVLNHGHPVGGATVRYAITGANPSSGSVGTDADGAATITLTGSQPGQDTLTAYVDSDNNGVFDPTIDTQQTAVFSWTASPPPPAVAPPPAFPPPLSVSAPSNHFAVLATKVGAGGVIRLTLRSPSAGAYRAAGTSRLSSHRTFTYGRGHTRARRGARATLTLRPTATAKRRIKTADLRVAIAVRFTPAGGATATKRQTVIVKARRRQLRRGTP